MGYPNLRGAENKAWRNRVPRAFVCVQCPRIGPLQMDEGVGVGDALSPVCRQSRAAVSFLRRSGNCFSSVSCRLSSFSRKE